jgi:hypothetical protein
MMLPSFAHLHGYLLRAGDGLGPGEGVLKPAVRQP